jgi:hypothetical protein
MYKMTCDSKINLLADIQQNAKVRGLHGVYNLIEVISNEPSKNCDQSLINN